MAIDVIALH